MVTDHIFYYEFLTEVSTELYNDYDILNEFLIKKYNINVPKELINIVGFKKGTSKLINEKSICKFINIVSKVNLDEYLKGLKNTKS